jgi:CheY-like chemotaxis protein
MPKTLLLADDSVTIQKVVGISFASEDIQLVTVDNGTAAVAKAKEIRPDIVLADVVMPGLNGYEVCRQIKGDPALRHVPVLLLTGTFEAFDENRAREAGSDGHITKPFEAQALVELVNARLAAAATPAPPAPAPASAPARSESASPLFGDDEEPFDFMSDEVTEPSGTRRDPALAEDALSFGAGDDLDLSDEGDLGATPVAAEAMTQVALADADSGVAPFDDSDEDENAETLPPVHDEGEEADAPAVTSILLGDDEPEGSAGDAATRVMFGETEPSAASEPEPSSADPFVDLIGGDRGPRRDLVPTDLGDPFADEAEAPLAPAASATVVMAGIDETDPFDAPLAAREEPALAVAPPPAPARDLPAAALPSRDELRNLLEKMAWEAFGDVTDRIVRETVQRVEQIAWEVIPKMAETLIREEIRKLKESDEQ